MGVTVWAMVDHEADDALGAAALPRRHRRHAVEQALILTPDKDLGQCVAGAASSSSIVANASFD